MYFLYYWFYQFIKQKSAELLKIRLVARIFGPLLVYISSIDEKIRTKTRSASRRLTKSLFGLDDKDFKAVRRPESRKRSKKLT